MATAITNNELIKFILDYACDPNGGQANDKFNRQRDQIYKFDALRFKEFSHEIEILAQNGSISFKTLKWIQEYLSAASSQAANKHKHDLNRFPNFMHDYRIVFEGIIVQLGKTELLKVSDGFADGFAVQSYRDRLKEEDLKKITVLKISGKKISHFPPEFFRLTSLKTLDLSNNEITEIPQGFANFTNLTELSLAHNKLSSILPFLFDMPIKNLNLSHNHIKIVPAALAKMPLRHLNLSHNPFKELPDEVANLIGGCTFLLRGIHFPVVLDPFGRLFRV